MDPFIHSDGKYTDEELCHHIMVLYVASTDTTATLVSTCLLYLAMYPEIQDKVHNEISDIFGKESELDIDYEKLSSLKYMEQVIKETLRLFGPLPFNMRESIEDCDVGIGETLKKGTAIFIFNHLLHRREDIWGPNANKFDPENFSDEKIAQRDPYSFVPFGGVSDGKLFQN
jgi:cytochrome P450 family 4